MIAPGCGRFDSERGEQLSAGTQRAQDLVALDGVVGEQQRLEHPAKSPTPATAWARREPRRLPGVTFAATGPGRRE
jgi:hypothetical protein